MTILQIIVFTIGSMIGGGYGAYKAYQKGVSDGFSQGYIQGQYDMGTKIFGKHDNK